jgi:hypothetical protein
MLRSATILALMGTAAAAGTYPADDVACGYPASILACDAISSQEECEVNTNCQYKAYDDNGRCMISEAVENLFTYAVMNASAALMPQRTACQAFTTQAVCVGSCAWGIADGEAEESCLVSRNKAQTILIADGADPYTKGMIYVFSSDETACPLGGTDEAKCNAITACDWRGTNCKAHEYATFLLINSTCKGSMSELILERMNVEQTEEVATSGEPWTNFTTIAQVYNMTRIPDETDTSKFAAQAELKVVAAATATVTATTHKAAILSESRDLAAEDKVKLEFLATIAISGDSVKKIVVSITADTVTAACAEAFTKMGLTISDGYCSATTARRRNLLTAYSTTVLLDPAKVDTAAASAAVTKIKADATVTVTVTDENPVDEIASIPNLNAASVATFRASSTVAGEANQEAAAYQAAETDADASGTFSVAAVSALATAALAAALCVFA